MTHVFSLNKMIFTEYFFKGHSNQESYAPLHFSKILNLHIQELQKKEINANNFDME